MTKISVLMPAYNAGQYIKEAVESILIQSYEDFELIIVDDGSTDETVDIINSFKDKRIKLYKNEKNMGLPYTRNKLLSLAKGEYIAIMDSDDIAVKDRFKKQVKFLDRNNDVAVIGTNFMRYNGKVKSLSNASTAKEEVKIKLLFMNCIANPTVMFRREFIEKHNIKYNPDFIIAQDYEFWIQCANHGGLANLKQYLLKYRSGHDSITKKTKASRVELRTNLIRNIRIKALENYGFNLENDDLEIYIKVLDDTNWSYSKDELLSFSGVLEKMITQNDVIGKFSRNKFKKVCHEVWSDRVCKSSLSSYEKVKYIYKYGYDMANINNIKYIIKSIV